MIFNKENVEKLNKHRKDLKNIPDRIPDKETPTKDDKDRMVELVRMAESLSYDEQHAVAMGLNPFIMIDAVRELMYEQNEYLRSLENGGEMKEVI